MDESSSGIFLLFLLLLLLLSSFFSCSEAALLSVSRAKVRALRNKNKWGSHALEWLKHHPKKLIITILIGNNVVNILLPVLTTIWATNKFGSHVVGIVTGILTVLLLLFGEILPKNMGQMYSTRIALLVSPLIYFLVKILFPIVWILEKFSDALLISKNYDQITEDEVLAMVSLGAEGGAIEHEERQLIENVLEFSDTNVEEVMTPRTAMDVLDAETSLGTAVDFFIEHSHTRIPVFEGSVDNIIGVITIKQTLNAWKEYEDTKLIKNLDLKKPLFAPTTKKISDTFRDFQQNRTHIAIVIDEHGGTVGLVTMEDLLEEVFGDIVDEKDVEEKWGTKIRENVWVVKGGISLADLFEKIGVDLRENDEEKPLALFILERMQKIPYRGDSIKMASATLVIEKMNGHKIDKVRVLKK
ncbi:HlyC/CorC family transporter [Candidatus Peregrinibacteria bacterium]|nr:HlyC/CorC family transporter [Candidatus Peregrinibacteria bacterium]